LPEDLAFPPGRVSVVFKTARFKVHNPSQHKQAMLNYALEHYHLTLKRVLEATLADPDLLTKITMPDKRGKPRVNAYAISRVLYRIAPKNWALAPLRDYLIGDAKAMLLSHFKKAEKGKNKSNPPSISSLEPVSDEQFRQAYRDFTDLADLPLKPQQHERIEQERSEGHARVANRLEKIYRNWSVSRAAGELLRRLDGGMPRPIEFTRPEFSRGYLLARHGKRYTYWSGYLQPRTTTGNRSNWRTAFSIGEPAKSLAGANTLV
jgi:hypothetical protein